MRVRTQPSHAHNNAENEENFRDQKANHEIHENIVPRKFGAIRYGPACKQQNSTCTITEFGGEG